ncbi:hypothetical protein JCM17823_26240 [Halorubrum gandharaense]
MSDRTRRRFLRALSAPAVALSSATAGCLDDLRDDAGEDGHVSPDSTPDPDDRVDPLRCDAELGERYTRWVDEDAIEWGDATDEDGDTVLELRVAELDYELGDTVEITLENVTEESFNVENPNKANLDVLTTEGWQDVRVWRDDAGILPDSVTLLDPGETVEWSLELTAAGIEEFGEHMNGDPLVCPDLQPGRYRFATHAPMDGDVAVAFDVTG